MFTRVVNRHSQLHVAKGRRLSPEEDSLIVDADEIDDSLPGDLWFRRRQKNAPNRVIFESLPIDNR
jgi:hypothetical protein